MTIHTWRSKWSHVKVTFSSEECATSICRIKEKRNCFWSSVDIFKFWKEFRGFFTFQVPFYSCMYLLSSEAHLFKFNQLISNFKDLLCSIIAWVLFKFLWQSVEFLNQWVFSHVFILLRNVCILDCNSFNLFFKVLPTWIYGSKSDQKMRLLGWYDTWRHSLQGVQICRLGLGEQTKVSVWEIMLSEKRCMVFGLGVHGSINKFKSNHKENSLASCKPPPGLPPMQSFWFSTKLKSLIMTLFSEREIEGKIIDIHSVRFFCSEGMYTTVR